MKEEQEKLEFPAARDTYLSCEEYRHFAPLEAQLFPNAPWRLEPDTKAGFPATNVASKKRWPPSIYKK